MDEISAYFLTEQNETIGIVAAENIVDFFLQTSGNSIYNKALDDIRPILAQELENTLANIEVSLRKKEDLKKDGGKKA